MPYKNYKDQVLYQWRSYGIITDVWDKLYETYQKTTHCQICNAELITGNYGSNKKVIDHDHMTGMVRYICCHSCNMNMDKKKYKNNTSGERNIHETKFGTYAVRKQVRGKRINENFKTLDEAIEFRNSLDTYSSLDI